LWQLDVGWDGATEAETAALVGWLRVAPNPQRHRKSRAAAENPKTGKPNLGLEYGFATINLTLAAVRGFYDFHAYWTHGPVVNPVPESPSRSRSPQVARAAPGPPAGCVPAARSTSRTQIDPGCDVGPAVRADALRQGPGIGCLLRQLGCTRRGTCSVPPWRRRPGWSAHVGRLQGLAGAMDGLVVAGGADLARTMPAGTRRFGRRAAVVDKGR
jgi:hypothetical protein